MDGFYFLWSGCCLCVNRFNCRHAHYPCRYRLFPSQPCVQHTHIHTRAGSHVTSEASFSIDPQHNRLPSLQVFVLVAVRWQLARSRRKLPAACGEGINTKEDVSWHLVCLLQGGMLCGCFNYSSFSVVRKLKGVKMKSSIMIISKK